AFPGIATARGRFTDALKRVLEALAMNGEEELALGREVVIDRAGQQADVACDVADRGAVVALCGEQACSCIQDQPAALGRLLLFARSVLRLLAARQALGEQAALEQAALRLRQCLRAPAFLQRVQALHRSLEAVLLPEVAH